MKTGVAQLIKDYLDECSHPHAWEEYRNRVDFRGERVGQAFFNCLSMKDKEALWGTLRDPFYSDHVDRIWSAIDYLTSKR